MQELPSASLVSSAAAAGTKLRDFLLIQKQFILNSTDFIEGSWHKAPQGLILLFLLSLFSHLVTD